MCAVLANMTASTKMSVPRQEQAYRFAGTPRDGRAGAELWRTRRKSLRSAVARLERVAAAAARNLTPLAGAERPGTGAVATVRGSIPRGPGLRHIADRLIEVEKAVAGARLR